MKKSANALAKDNEVSIVAWEIRTSRKDGVMGHEKVVQDLPNALLEKKMAPSFIWNSGGRAGSTSLSESCTIWGVVEGLCGPVKMKGWPYP